MDSSAQSQKIEDINYAISTFLLYKSGNQNLLLDLKDQIKMAF
ncbi:hypothetical protein PLUTE_a1654 [Pseudoalteromonas luteoviolacea DSM 6061]|nr:hypothetical protein [Pseudoalteromonas luteoviolacea DSM 6061]